MEIKKVIKTVLYIALAVALFLCYNAYVKYKNRDQYLSYEAYIEPTEYETIKIPCIADVIKSGREIDIVELHFPFGKSQYCEYVDWEEGYDEKTKSAKISIPTYEDSYEAIIVFLSEADSDSQKKIDEKYERNCGEAFASKNSDFFHIFYDPECPNGKQIKYENKIRFYDSRDAEIMGFQMCSWCREHR